MDEITDKKIHVIHDATENTQVLQGLTISTSKQAQDTIENQKSRALTNIEKAKELQSRLDQLESTRIDTNDDIANARLKEKEWIKVEEDMYRAIQPFSMPALQQQLERSIKDSEQLSESLFCSFVDHEDESPDLKEFIKNYKKERKLYHLRKERANRWNEERVGKTF